jgi:uncharacterized repeat protein (TIGR01451 family)
MTANAAADASSIPTSFPSPAPSTPGTSSAPAVQSHARSLFAGLPLMFEPNQGQANLDSSDPRVKFIARGSGYSLMLGSEGAILNLRSPNPPSPNASKHAPATAQIESLRMKLAHSNPNASLTASDLLPSKSNYILGNDPAKWQHDVPQFARVRYENVYPGINLAFYGNQGRLEYDFQVAPGSDPAQAELEFDGAKHMELQDGNLVIEAEGGAVRLDAPRIYQQVDGRQQPVAGSFALRADNHVGFAIGPYDHTRELIIDPVLSYSTYFGGAGDEHSSQVAVDSVGNIYLAGSTTSTNLPAVGVFQTTLKGTQNVYIAKINPLTGANGLVYVTYLGGNGVDTPAGIAVDGAGNPYVAGTTSSTNFPTTDTGYQQVPEPGSAGTQHVFVTQLNNNVNGIATALGQYSSYLSGNGDDIASGMTIDTKGNVYVTGTTTSSDTSSPSVQFPASYLPQALPYQNIPRASIQFFVTKVNTGAPRTGSIAYSTYFGGGNFDTTTPIAVGGGIAVDVNQNIYFTGTTNFTYTGCQGCNTTDFPILNAYQPCLNQQPPAVIVNPPTCTDTGSGLSDAFVAKLNPTAGQGAQLLWSTYFGGAATDSGTGIAVDSGAANVYLTGTTNSPNVTTLTTFAAYQLCLNNLFDPTTKACTATSPAANDAFVARLTNPATNTTTITNVSLTYFSYLGGSNDEAGLAIAVDSENGAIITGWTKSPSSATGTNSGDFPVFPAPNPIQSQLNGTQDAFVARLNTIAVTGQNTVASWANYFGGSGLDQGTSITLDSNETIYMAGDTNSTNLQVAKPFQTLNGGGYDAFVTQLGTAASLSVTGSLSLGTNQIYVSAGSPATFTYIVTNNGPDLAHNIVVTDDIRPETTKVALTFNSASSTASTGCSQGGTGTSISCTIPSLQAGSTATVTFVLTPTPNSDGGSARFNGGTVTVSGGNNITPVFTSVSATMSDFTLTASPSSVTVPIAGAPATYELQLTPNPVYASNITLTCSGTPTGSSCNFSPASVNLSSASPAAPTLVISTTARPITVPVASLFSRHFYALWLPVPGLALLGLGMGRDRRRRRIAGILLLCAVLMLIVLQPACSGTTTQPPPSGTPAGSYPIVVTATSGSDTKSTSINLVVP